mmetsp:Transcript_21186/g.45962  ORF Transcript_21186/g.45962 Transcript_21186/m.45962 type:complete len:103 (-) Transcript_21186:192-500(-)
MVGSTEGNGSMGNSMGKAWTSILRASSKEGVGIEGNKSAGVVATLRSVDGKQQQVMSLTKAAPQVISFASPSTCTSQGCGNTWLALRAVHFRLPEDPESALS